MDIMGLPPIARDISAVESAQVGWVLAHRKTHRLRLGGQHLGELRGRRSVPGTDAILGTKVQIATILDQGDDGEVAQVNATQIETWFQVYMPIKRAHPVEEEEPTAAQLTALHHRVNAVKATPYADFTLGSPFGHKAQCAGKFWAWLPAPGGG
eukprot:6767502-Heterocapsa_arctica.AAC.1